LRWREDLLMCGKPAVEYQLNMGVTGGFEMRQRGSASQCLPLDFPGCRKHWDA
jgi:hypothetical protein